MNKLILMSYIDNSKVIKSLAKNNYQFFDTFSKYGYKKEGFKSLELAIKGKTYKEKANNLRELAVDFQNFNMDECDIDFSYLELSIICSWFKKKAHRFGLTKEFKENGII